MEIQIKLNAGSGRLLDKSPFLLADNDTPTLVFKSDIFLTDCIVEMKNGDEKEKLHIRGLSSVQLPEKLCKAGAVECVIGLMVNGIAVRKWSVEPIVLKEVDLGFEAYGVLNRYDEAIERLTETNLQLTEKCTSYEKRLDEIDAFLKRLEDY